MPLQSTTDCGSETTVLFGLANALRCVTQSLTCQHISRLTHRSMIFHPDFDLTELPAHMYVRSIHNISIERSWLRLRLDWGDNMVIFFKKGIEDGMYNPDDPQQ